MLRDVLVNHYQTCALIGQHALHGVESAQLTGWKVLIAWYTYIRMGSGNQFDDF